MLKKLWKNAKKPLWKMTKFIHTSGFIITGISLVFHSFNLFTNLVATGPQTFGELFTSLVTTYLTTFQILLFVLTPFILLYSTVKTIFMILFPKKEKGKKHEKTQNYDYFPYKTRTSISKRKTDIQKIIVQLLEENKSTLDIEEIHILERINEELLTKAEESYESLDKETKERYEKEVLSRFDELEEMALETVKKVKRERENQLKKQLHIIDEITK